MVRYYIHRTIDVSYDIFKAAMLILLFLSIFIPGSISFWAPNS